MILFAALPVARAAAWRSYAVYEPSITRHFVVNCNAQRLKYNHDSSIAWFRDRWFCLWNGNEPAAEGRPGQLNYASTSRDGRAWSEPVPCFASAEHSVNPVPCPRGTQWQPNLIGVEDQLWAFWSHNSRDERKGCYLSRLREPEGKWENRRLLWAGEPRPVVDGKRFRLFPTQNPIRLRSGRLLAPVTMIGPHAADAPEGMKSWWATEKRDSVLYSDDLGETWHVSPGAIQPGRSWAQWEPTVWELDDGTVMMFARNNDFRDPRHDGPRPAEMLQWSKSTDGGATWTPHAAVPLDTVASRMHVLPCGGDRFAMVHNDSPAGPFVGDRRNLALFFTRGAGFDFVVGPGLTASEPVVAYPQAWIRGDQMLISYSQGRAYRSIKVARVTPLPDPDRYYLFPRRNVSSSGGPSRDGAAFHVNGHSRIETRRVLDPGENSFSAGAWLRLERPGVLLDNRSTDPPAGVLWGLAGHPPKGRPFFWADTPEKNIVSSLALEPGAWNYVGITVDNRAGRVAFHVNGEFEELSFKAPAPRPLRSTTAFIGHKRFEGSRVPGFAGKLRAVAFYANARLGTAEHNALHNAFAEELGREPRQPARKPEKPPTFLLDGASRKALEPHFVVPETSASVETCRLDGKPCLRFRGQASAGVDLDENYRGRGDVVDMTFRFRTEGGAEHVICTVGDANAPARLVARDGVLRLEADGQQVRCGPARPDAWTDVRLTTEGSRTTVTVEGQGRASVAHEPAATWLYLGEGYPRKNGDSGGRFVIDVGSVRTRVRGDQE
jgi:hypothetical protein